MSFLIKFAFSLCGLYGVAEWYAKTPSGSYGTYLLQCLVAGIFVVFLVHDENVSGRIFRLRYRLRKKMSH